MYDCIILDLQGIHKKREVLMILEVKIKLQYFMFSSQCVNKYVKLILQTSKISESLNLGNSLLIRVS